MFIHLEVNSVDRLNRYYRLHIEQKCFAWSDSGTKNVSKSDRSNIVPAQKSTNTCSGINTSYKAKHWSLLMQFWPCRLVFNRP